MTKDHLEPDELICRADDPHRPSLENRVAFQWESGLDTLGYRNATIRDQLTLCWAADALRTSGRPASVVDIGCSRGNFLIMLNAMLERDQAITYHGFDIDERALAFPTEFAAEVNGYANCEFGIHSIEEGLPFDDGSQEVVVANDVVEHLPDVLGVFREMARVTRPGGSVVISTPLADSAFKRVAALTNRVTRGQLYRPYYSGKDSALDDEGQPVMDVHAGHDHISEMSYPELIATLDEAGLRVADQRLMPIMSGSRWFDEHPFILSGLVLAEAVHQVLQRPSWAHGICMRLEPVTR